MLHNPNTSREACKVGTVIEAEAVAMLAAMVGYDPAKAEGHFTSGGTGPISRPSGAPVTGSTTGSGLGSVSPRDRRAARRVRRGAHGLGPNPGAVDRARADRPCSAPLQRRRRRAGKHLAPDQPGLGSRLPGPVLLVPGNKHCSWSKAANLSASASSPSGQWISTPRVGSTSTIWNG